MCIRDSALRDLQLSKEIGNRYHICHISTKETVAGLREYRKQGLPVSGEACPHHLILTDENIKNLNPNYKMNPPLRSKEDLDALIEGLKDGTVTCLSLIHILLKIFKSLMIILYLKVQQAISI